MLSEVSMGEVNVLHRKFFLSNSSHIELLVCVILSPCLFHRQLVLPRIFILEERVVVPTTPKERARLVAVNLSVSKQLLVIVAISCQIHMKANLLIWNRVVRVYHGPVLSLSIQEESRKLVAGIVVLFRASKVGKGALMICDQHFSVRIGTCDVQVTKSLAVVSIIIFTIVHVFDLVLCHQKSERVMLGHHDELVICGH